MFWIVMAVQCGGQACQRTSISGLAILLSHTGHGSGHTGHIGPGQAGPDVAGHSFRPPAMARVARGASQTMLPRTFGGKQQKYRF